MNEILEVFKLSLLSCEKVFGVNQSYQFHSDRHFDLVLRWNVLVFRSISMFHFKKCAIENFKNYIYKDTYIKKYIYKEFNSTFLTLIAEVPNSMELRDYRPISIVGVIYKLILKIFAN